MTDPHPEDDIKENDLQPLRGISDIDADICCTLAYAVLKLMKNPPTQVSYFLPELEAKYETEYYVLDEENKEFEQALSFIKQKKSTLGSWQIDLWPHPTNKCLKWLSKPHRTEKRRNTFNPRMTTIWKTTNRNRRK